MTQRRMEILNETQFYLNENEAEELEKNGEKGKAFVKFTFADVHGNLKLVLNRPYNNRSVFSFNTVLEFFQIIDKVSTISSYPYEDMCMD